jgi:CBS domain-containing protein
MGYIVRDWMAKPVIVVDGSTTVAHALTLMRRRNIHSLLVDYTQRGKPVHGIVTTTDIRDKIVEVGRDPARTAVSEIMTSPVHTAAPTWSLQACAQRMHELNIHHLPVAETDGAFIGMISATDIFAAVEETGWDALG